MSARKRGFAEGYNEFLVGVFYNVGPGPDRFIAHGRLTADMGCAPPEPPITDAEMQHVAFAAKMAMAKVLLARKRAAKRSRR